MGERSLRLTPSDRALEQAIVGLKKGAYILKYGPRGKPKLCPFRLSSDERSLIWFSGKNEKKLQLSLVTSIIHGHGTRKLQPGRESHSFSLIYMKNQAQCSLDLICKDKVQADSWFLGLKALISRCPDVAHLESQRVAESCINSPSSFIRRKYNLGFQKQTTKTAQVRSKCVSPIPSLSDRCFSDGLSFSSDSFYSRSSLSSVHNLTDSVVAFSPCVKHEGPKTNVKMVSRKPERTKPSDVLIWGEGVENGLLPKVVDSVSMLDVEKISLAGKNGVFLTKQGEVFSWGEGKSGRVGHSINCVEEVESLNGVDVKSVSCSEYQTCAITVSGEVYIWGCQSSRWLPRRVSGVLDGVIVSMVSCGEWHTAIVSTSGQLFTFGDGTFGVLGHGNCQSLTKPKEVESLKGMPVKSVACGTWHTAAVVGVMRSSTPAGKLFTWGDGDKGRLGHSNLEMKDKPTCVRRLIDQDFVQVSCGRMLTVGLTNTGSVYTIGSSIHGQLGNPLAPDSSLTLVQGNLKFEFVRQIASGSYHVAVLTSKGSVYTWGKGANGQLGVGDTQDRNSPTLVEVTSHRQVQSISCGSSSTAAICLHESVTFGMDQSVCRGCNMEFGFMKKKHNCYNCGFLFCSLCSCNKSKTACLAPDERKSFRVCDSCYRGLSGHTLKTEDITPRPSLIKTVSEHTCDNNQGASASGLDSVSLVMYQAPRWGRVSSPTSFRMHCKADSLSRVSVRENENHQKVSRPSVDSTVKHKGATDIIKALTSRLHLMSPRAFMRKHAKARVDTPTTSSKHLTTSVKDVPCDIDTRDGDETTTLDEPVVKQTVSNQTNVKQKHEWTEQYHPGVYITLVILANGRKGIKRVRFSRRLFREREAERWWEDNQQEVYDKYNVDGYVNSF